MPAPVIEEPQVDWELEEKLQRHITVRNLAYVVFGLISIITLAVLFDVLSSGPSKPVFASNLNAEQQKAVLENYKSLNSAVMERAKEMFDLMVVKALLPVFATIVGVLLGRRTESA